MFTREAGVPGLSRLFRVQPRRRAAPRPATFPAQEKSVRRL